MTKKIKKYEARCNIKIYHNGKSAQASIEHCLGYVSKFNLDLSNIRAYLVNERHSQVQYEVQMQLEGPLKGPSKLDVVKKLVSISKKLHIDVEDIDIYEP